MNDYINTYIIWSVSEIIKKHRENDLKREIDRLKKEIDDLQFELYSMSGEVYGWESDE